MENFLKKATAIVIALIAGSAAIGAPIAAALYLAHRQSLDVEKEQALLLAGEVMRRAELIGDQADLGVKRLAQAKAADPCSNANITLMRELDLRSSYLQTFGYVSGNRLLCSGLGRHDPGIPLGPPDYVSARGAAIRTSVNLPFAPDVKFFVAEQDSYVAVIHPGLTTDVFTDRQNISLGVVGGSSGRVMTQRGKFDPAWQRSLEAGQSAAFFDGSYVVAVLRSSRYDYVSFAATPSLYLDQRVRTFTLTLVPIGIAVGLLLAGALLILARQQMSLPSVMRSALRRKEFFMVYQPVVELATGRCTGMEALIRWRRPDGTSMLPDLFIPVAEDSGLIRQITGQMMEMVADDMTDLLRRYPDLRIGFNLSSFDLHDRHTVKLLRDFVRGARTKPENIVVEATERGLLGPDAARDVIREIRAMGVRVAIDDFGTGYSSLSYLTTLEVDYLKIDKSFVDAVDTDAATSHVALHIIEMAKSLNLMITAEGVETASQAAFLRQHGVQYAQGWLFGKPMPVEELAAWLEQHQT
jgi:sensor c-di-GMP phosphodiesterase-like protein